MLSPELQHHHDGPSQESLSPWERRCTLCNTMVLQRSFQRLLIRGRIVINVQLTLVYGGNVILQWINNNTNSLVFTLFIGDTLGNIATSVCCESPKVFINMSNSCMKFCVTSWVTFFLIGYLNYELLSEFHRDNGFVRWSSKVWLNPHTIFNRTNITKVLRLSNGSNKYILMNMRSKSVLNGFLNQGITQHNQKILLI